ncbi:MAG TPA: hypothetical protein VIF15_12255 [Polyangiaceae bacterium]|jgi:hypothetical protein
MRGRAAIAVAIAAGVALAACNGGTSDSGPTVRSCRGVSAVGLETEATTASQCPASPAILTGKQGPGGQCGSSADCAPVCCSCPGGAKGADAALCSDGNCLDAATTCCLFALACD